MGGAQTAGVCVKRKKLVFSQMNCDGSRPVTPASAGVQPLSEGESYGPPASR
jgi:hypothetical protein